jgi:tetratricopeptide (TPR) repeat protein
MPTPGSPEVPPMEAEIWAQFNDICTNQKLRDHAAVLQFLLKKEIDRKDGDPTTFTAKQIAGSYKGGRYLEGPIRGAIHNIRKALRAYYDGPGRNAPITIAVQERSREYQATYERRSPREAADSSAIRASEGSVGSTVSATLRDRVAKPFRTVRQRSAILSVLLMFALLLVLVLSKYPLRALAVSRIQRKVHAAETLRSEFRYREARLILGDAAHRIDPGTDRSLWIETTLKLADAEAEEGEFTGGEESGSALAAAVGDYNKLRLELNRPSDRHDLTVLKVKLCNALTLQGERSNRMGNGGIAIPLYVQAAEFCNAAAQEAQAQNDMVVWARAENGFGKTLFRRGELTGDNDESQRFLAQAGEAYNAALTITAKNKAERPKDYAVTKSNLGSLYVRQGQFGDTAQAPARFVLAVATFKEALDYWAQSGQNQARAKTEDNFGTVLLAQARRSEPNVAVQLLQTAVEAYTRALLVRTEKKLPQAFAWTEDNLGLALCALGYLRSGDEGKNLFNDAVNAHRAALRVYTRKDFPQDYALTSTNLAFARIAQQDWRGAVESIEHTLDVYPDHTDSLQRLESIYHDHLFSFSKAFELSQRLFELDKDKSADTRLDLVENNLTTGRFAQCIELLNGLGQLKPQPAIIRGLLRYACQYGKTRESDTTASANGLIAMAEQHHQKPEDASFEGTKHFLSTSSAFATSSKYWVSLFDHFEAGDGAGMAEAVRQIQETTKR